MIVIIIGTSDGKTLEITKVDGKSKNEIVIRYNKSNRIADNRRQALNE